MDLDISTYWFMLFTTFWILATLYWVTFWVRVLLILDKSIRQAFWFKIYSKK